MTKGPSWSEKKNNGRDLNSVWPINSNEKSLSSTISWTSPATRVDASSRLNFFTWVQLEVSCEQRLCRVTGNGNLLLPAMLQADECLQQGWFKGMWTFYSTCSSDTEPLSKKKSMFHTYWKKTITVTKWDEAPTSSREVHGSVFEPQDDSRSIIKSMLCWWPNVPTSRSPPFGLTTSRGSWNGFCNRCFKVLQLLITNSTTCNSFHLKLQTSYQLGLKILHCTLNLTKAAQAASALR